SVSAHSAARTGAPCHRLSASSKVAAARGCCGCGRRRALSSVSLGPAIARMRVSVACGSMPTQSVSIAVLLAGVMCRRGNHYVGGQVFGTVMRHELLAVAVVLRPRRVIEPAGSRSLVTPCRVALFAPTRRLRAGPRAVALAAVAASADEEDLPASDAATDD